MSPRVIMPFMVSAAGLLLLGNSHFHQNKGHMSGASGATLNATTGPRPLIPAWRFRRSDPAYPRRPWDGWADLLAAPFFRLYRHSDCPNHPLCDPARISDPAKKQRLAGSGRSVIRVGWFRAGPRANAQQNSIRRGKIENFRSPPPGAADAVNLKAKIDQFLRNHSVRAMYD
jgi:hypothetical protein